MAVLLSPWAALAAGLLVYYCPWRTLGLLALPLAAHELGHLFFLVLLGGKLRTLRVELFGLCIEYAGVCRPWQHALIAFGGPFFGALYALAAAPFGENGALSAGLSFLLTLFNLIPAPILDGGKIAAALLPEKTAGALGALSTAGVFCAGLWFVSQGRGAGLLVAGTALLVTQIKEKTFLS